MSPVFLILITFQIQHTVKTQTEDRIALSLANMIEPPQHHQYHQRYVFFSLD